MAYHHGNLRRALLEEAARAIQEGGVGELSLRDLARRAGVSHGAPARHFPDKQENGDVQFAAWQTMMRSHAIANGVFVAAVNRVGREDGIRFLSIDPGDMDTPLHAAALPDSDPATLRRPEDSAAEIMDCLVMESRGVRS